MKKQHVIIIGVVGALALLASFYLGQKTNLAVVTPAADNQAQVASCAKQAMLVVENEQKMEDQNTKFSQTNHYNKQLSKCFVEIVTTMSDDSGVIFSDEVRDAYEQKILLSCLSGSSVKSFCFIPGNISETGMAINMTNDEGQIMIRNYMSN